MIRFLFAAVFAAAAVVPAQAQPQQDAQPPDKAQQQVPRNAALHALFAEEWERELRESPESASYRGDPRYNDRWTDFSPEAIAARQAADRAALEKLRAIDRSSLSAADQLDYDTFLWQLQRGVERQRYREELRPISHRGGPQTLDGITEVLPFTSARDYEDWLKRLQALPVALGQVTELMRVGVGEGSMPPRILMQRVPAQIAGQVVDDPEKSGFYKPFLKMPESIPAQQRAELQGQARRIIASDVIPAYANLQAFFNDEYLPKSRDSIAAADLPNGKEYYDFLAGYYTTTGLSADEIHEIGLEEVARIRAEMEKVKERTGFDGSLGEFFTFLRTDPRFFHKTPEALLTAYQALSKRMDPELVKVVKTIPRLPYGVRAIPDSIAPDTTTAYYQPGATDGMRPGWYYVNLYKPEMRPIWEMVPLSLHEAVPGHHFQFARGLELPDAPMFRRTAHFVAYGEGWGLYAEQLGFEMGLYEDPYDHFGQLTYEMWRAVRLVVDTGMHAKGWSRDRAIAYFKDNAPKTDQDIVNEIDRYIGNPGQALAYKIGQMRISGMRAKAEAALGERFDLREFNDAVLETGSVPLQALERHIDAWIDAQREPAGG